MQLAWEKSAASDFDHELVWLTVSVGGAAAAALWLWLGLPWPRCNFLALTGHPCVTCGATRAALQFAHGNFTAAWLLNPLVSVGYVAIALFDLYAIAVLSLGLPRLRFRTLSVFEKKAGRVAILVLLVANWSYLLWNT